MSLQRWRLWTSVCVDCFLVEYYHLLIIVIPLPLGKVYANARYGDIAIVVASLRYYAGWADKVQGKTIEVSTITLFNASSVLNALS